MTNKPTTEFRLGVRGLPQIFDTMIPGGLYALQISSPPARNALVTQCVTAGTEQGRVGLISNGSLQRLIHPPLEAGVDTLSKAIHDGKLTAFRLKESSAKNIFRNGPERFTLEIEHFKVPDDALIVFDGADDLFTLQDPFVVAEQARVYREWMRRRGGCGVLVFSKLSSTSQFSAAYQTLLDHLDGAVRLESGAERLSWSVDFWTSPLGMAASRTLGAQIRADASLEISDAQDLARGMDSMAPAQDEDDVFCMDSTLAGVARHGEGHWVFCDNLMGLLHATRSSTAASIILLFDHGTDLRELAQVSHILRVSLGKRIRLLVRELNASLRYQNELLLMHLGVNMIIHRDVPVARVQLALESLKGVVFDRDVDVDFESALRSVAPSHACGLLPHEGFVKEVTKIVGHSKELGIPYVLVRITIPDGMSAQTAADHFKLVRGGDVMTFNERFLLLFVSACPQASLLATLKRIGGESIQDIFPDMEFAVREEAVTSHLGQLSLAKN